MRTLNISDEEMNDIIKIVKPLEISCLLIKRVSVAVEYEAKEQKCSQYVIKYIRCYFIRKSVDK